MAIVSVSLKGKMPPIDSLGYSTLLQEGAVQITSAGNGMRHEEYNIGDEEVTFLQIWIQPKQQNIIPRYQQRHFPIAKRTNKLQTMVSNEEGLEHCWINQNAKLSLGYFEEAQELTYILSPINKCVFIFSIDKTIRVDSTGIQKRDAIGVWETDRIPIYAKTGAPFPDDRNTHKSKINVQFKKDLCIVAYFEYIVVLLAS